MVVVVAVVAGFAVGGNGNGNKKTSQYAIGLWSDLPYSAVQENPGIPNLIAELNGADIQFTVNDGDLKAGNGTSGNPPSAGCDDPLYERALGWLNSLEKPAMFTPGDNDWTDCDRTSNGGFNSLERLDHERTPPPQPPSPHSVRPYALRAGGRIGPRLALLLRSAAGKVDAVSVADLTDHTGRDAGRHHAGRQISCDDRAGADDRVVADRHSGADDDAPAEPHVVAKRDRLAGHPPIRRGSASIGCVAVGTALCTDLAAPRS